ncbi:unnamed protein product [Staurois parvus]|uniref:Uncharacterized protein n=1 Tax=Staurois parvus TaxID=386267 RepID=A0ABN9CQ18_9NEOB|nr:unnamed protein product [Staurois parvus]
MCPLQHPRPSPLADAGIRLLCSGPCDVRAPPAAGDLKIQKKCHFFQNDFTYPFHIHFVPSALSCPVCILNVLSAWKLRKVHGIQKASLLVKSGFRSAREQR